VAGRLICANDAEKILDCSELEPSKALGQTSGGRQVGQPRPAQGLHESILGGWSRPWVWPVVQGGKGGRQGGEPRALWRVRGGQEVKSLECQAELDYLPDGDRRLAGGRPGGR